MNMRNASIRLANAVGEELRLDEEKTSLVRHVIMIELGAMKHEENPSTDQSN